MTKTQIKKLKNIAIMDTDAFYRFKIGIQYTDKFGTSRYLYPVFVQFITNEVYDYTSVAQAFLRRKRITEDDVFDGRFSLRNNSRTKVYKMRDLTPEKAQEIIDNNIALFTQITKRIKEQVLIDQINNI